MKISHIQKITSTENLFIIFPEKIHEKYFEYLGSEILNDIKFSLTEKVFTRKAEQIIRISSSHKKVQNLFLVGGSEVKEMSNITAFTGKIISFAREQKMKNISIALHNGNTNIREVVQGSILANYQFKIGDKKKHFAIKSVECLSAEKTTPKQIQGYQDIANAMNTAKDLINTPANLLMPKDLAQIAKKIARKNSRITIEVLGEKRILTKKMGLMYAVGKGSAAESQLIVLKYMGGKKSEAPVALVGKGVCFDSGGYNLKPTNYIEDMKIDMSGAATVLGIFDWIASAKPKKNIIGVIGAVENMISSNAYRPGDVITGMNGKTVEILNTDAEGRLVLADCLHYTEKKFKPSRIIDFATLTGAVVVALGNEITGVMGNNEELVSNLNDSARNSGEMIWELPLLEKHKKLLHGRISDLANHSYGKVGMGASIGGLFLWHFVEKTPWVHVDIAGSAYHENSSSPLESPGATGVMIRTMADFLS